MAIRSEFTKTEDGSLVDSEGKIIGFSLQRFERDIRNGDCCFICGAERSSKQFNDEHIIPRWLLRKHSLFGSHLYIPNGQLIQYDRYKVPCCADCNSFLGRRIETPVRDILEKGYESVKEHLVSSGPSLLFRWMSLLYIKTHLKDATHPWELDRRKGDAPIGERYDWSSLHHIHAVARSILFDIPLGPGSIGTLIVLPMLPLSSDGTFDYCDMYQGRTLLLRSGETLILAVLDDSCAALEEISSTIQRISAPLIAPQARELLAQLTHSNISLTNRPRFSTAATPWPNIAAEVPSPPIFDWSALPSYGDILWHLCSPFLEGIQDPEKRSAIAEGIRKGLWSWLQDESGNFPDNSRFADH
jgi:hypothetical protein